MKNSKLKVLLLASLFSVAVLSGCDNGDISFPSIPSTSDVIPGTSESLPPSSDPGSDPGSIESLPPTTSEDSLPPASSDSLPPSTSETHKTDWTDDEKLLMQRNLYGVVLPFVAEDVGVYADTGETGGIYMRGRSHMESGFLREYASNFDSDHWKGGDVSFEMDCPNGTLFAFVTEVSTSSGARHVSVLFGGLATNGTEGYEETGVFFLEANDPFLYEYPETFINKAISENFGSAIYPPNPGANYYSIDYEREALLAYYPNDSIERTYKEALTATRKFTIADSRDSLNNVVAQSNDGKYCIRFHYDGSIGALVITVSAYQGWNATVINAFFEKYGATPFEIPGIYAEGVTFKFEESEYNAQTPGYETATITIGKATAAIANAYMLTLQQAGFRIGECEFNEVDGGSVYAHYLTATGMAMLTISYTPGAKTILIGISLAYDKTRVSDWPTDVANRAGEVVQDTVPAYVDPNHTEGFGIGTSGNYTFIVVYVAEGEEQAAMDRYVTTLTRDNGYEAAGTYHGQPCYVSAHHEVKLSIACDPSGLPGRIQILIIPAKGVEWPTSDIATRLRKMGVTTDTLPALPIPATEINKAWVTENEEFKVWCNVGSEHIEEAYDEYNDVLYEDYEFQYLGENRYRSPNDEFIVRLDDQGDYFYIYVSSVYAEWPVNDVASGLILVHQDIPQDSLPAPTGVAAKARNYILSPDYFNHTLQIDCIYSSVSATQAAEAQYIAQIGQTWTPGETDANDRPHFISPNEEFDVCIYRIDITLYIFVKAAGSSSGQPTAEWPYRAIADLMGGDYWICLPMNLPVEGIASFSSPTEMDGLEGYVTLTATLAADAVMETVLADIGTYLLELDGYGFAAMPNADNCYYNALLFISLNVMGENQIMIMIGPMEFEEPQYSVRFISGGSEEPLSTEYDEENGYLVVEESEYLVNDMFYVYNGEGNVSVGFTELAANYLDHIDDNPSEVVVTHSFPGTLILIPDEETEFFTIDIIMSKPPIDLVLNDYESFGAEYEAEYDEYSIVDLNLYIGDSFELRINADEEWYAKFTPGYDGWIDTFTFTETAAEYLHQNEESPTFLEVDKGFQGAILVKLGSDFHSAEIDIIVWHEYSDYPYGLAMDDGDIVGTFDFSTNAIDHYDYYHTSFLSLEAGRRFFVEDLVTWDWLAVEVDVDAADFLAVEESGMVVVLQDFVGAIIIGVPHYTDQPITVSIFID